MKRETDDERRINALLGECSRLSGDVARLRGANMTLRAENAQLGADYLTLTELVSAAARAQDAPVAANGARRAYGDTTQADVAPRRLPECVEAWPGCAPGEYNPACCRFPKSCSCTDWRDTKEPA